MYKVLEVPDNGWYMVVCVVETSDYTAQYVVDGFGDYGDACAYAGYLNKGGTH